MAIGGERSVVIRRLVELLLFARIQSVAIRAN